ncbi:2-dehydro-3-deoxygalactonokinase [Stenotrophomonas sp. PS02289]|uniref:2-dehydro-3-deoxygalactonokinase n=1 Tax=Stenotrophomonas sp. PS02289 TaxID=2991422 RepID=UPI002499B410|nr:2-dehydro-3-deoxygalactonokinase [Stenotrophomonas sp. PS02289]
MAHHGNDNIIGINWGSSNLRAYLITPGGAVLDAHEEPAGVATLSREGMVIAADSLRARWPHAQHAYAAGMIGSNVGWVDAGYVACPAGVDVVAQQLVETRIGSLALRIVPGMACVRSLDGAPDVMRGEETELLGLLSDGAIGADAIVALPGTHTKWIQLRSGEVESFMTAMSGELFDRLAGGGLLASVLEGPGAVGPAFLEGVRGGAKGALGLGALLFGVRARVIRGMLERADSSSYLRGVLVGAEIGDAMGLFPALGDRDARAGQRPALPVVGSGPVTVMYQAALSELGVESRGVASADAVVRGFAAIHAMASAPR